MDEYKEQRNTASSQVRQLKERLEDMEAEVDRLNRLSAQRFFGRNKLRGAAAATLRMEEKSNIDAVKAYFKTFFCHVKFPHVKMYDWSPSDRNTISHRLLRKITWPRNQEKEHYFETVVAPAFNRVWNEKTSNVNTTIKDQFMRKLWRKQPFRNGISPFREPFREPFQIQTCLTMFFLVYSSGDKSEGMNMEKFVSDLKTVQVGTYKELDESMHDSIIHFLAKYVVKLYGVHRIRAWMGKNKGLTFLDMVTMSDLSYVTAVLENKVLVWEQDYETKDYSKADKDKFKLHVWKGLPSSAEKERFRKVQPKFSSSQGQKKRYLSHGWSKAGVLFYEKGVQMWKSFSSDKDAWQGLEVLWDDYVREKGFLRGEYRATNRNEEDNVEQGGEEGGDAEDEYRLVLPDDDGFDDGRAWKTMEELPLAHLGPQDDDVEKEDEEEEEVHGKVNGEDTPLRGRNLDNKFGGEFSPLSPGTSPKSPNLHYKKPRLAVTASAKHGGRAVLNDENKVNEVANTLINMGSPSSSRSGVNSERSGYRVNSEKSVRRVNSERSGIAEGAHVRTYPRRGRTMTEEEYEDHLERARRGGGRNKSKLNKKRKSMEMNHTDLV